MKDRLKGKLKRKQALTGGEEMESCTPMKSVRRIVLSACLFGASVPCADELSAADEPAADVAEAGILLDQPMRTVNTDVITMGDVRERTWFKLQMLQRQNPGVQIDRRTFARFQLESLEELTEQSLLLQEADRNKVVVDERRIRKQVLFQIDKAQVGGHIEQVAQAVEERVRQQRIQRVLGQYLYLGGNVSPEDVLAAYDANPDRWMRPGRARVRQIVLRVVEDQEIDRLRDGLFAVYRRIQTDPSPVVAALVTDADLDTLLDRSEEGTGPDSQFAFLLQKATDVVNADVANAGGETLALREDAQRYIAEAAQLRDEATITALLNTWREELMALPPGAERRARFGALARQYSQGQGAEDEGMLGWVEEGSLPGPRNEIVFAATQEDTVSEPVWSGSVCALLLVESVQSGRIQSFSEVSADIEAELTAEHEQKIRKRLLDQLRAKAHIVDVVPLQ